MAADKRTAILQATRALFAAQPFQDVGTRDICVGAGIANGSLFHVLTDKVALAAELYQAACQRRDQVVATALAAWPDDPSRTIQAAVAALVRFMGSGEVDACLLRLFATDRDGLAGLVAVLTPWARPMQAVARIAPVAPSVVAVLLWGVARAWTIFPAACEGATTEEATAEVAERIWQALQPPAAEAAHRRKPKVRTSSTLPAELDLFRRRG